MRKSNLISFLIWCLFYLTLCMCWEYKFKVAPRAATYPFVGLYKWLVLGIKYGSPMIAFFWMIKSGKSQENLSLRLAILLLLNVLGYLFYLFCFLPSV